VFYFLFYLNPSGKQAYLRLSVKQKTLRLLANGSLALAEKERAER
jgi:hypothetical protein